MTYSMTDGAGQRWTVTVSPTIPCYYCGQPRDRETYATTECPCGRAAETRRRAERGEGDKPYRAPSLLDEQCMRAWEQKRGLR